MPGSRQTVGNWLQQVRAADWWLFRIATLLGVAYASIAFYELTPARAFPMLLRLLLSMICIAAFAHVVNDMADIEQDQRAGKANAMRNIRPRQRWLLSSGLLLCGFVVWIESGISIWALGLLAVIAVLQPLYAFPPTRLKERGLFGLVVDSLHTHALPTFFIVAVFAGTARAPVWQPFALTVTIWAFIVGLRGILYHQLLDETNDRQSGITTFVTAHGAAKTRMIAKRFVFPAEFIALFILGAAVMPFAPQLVIIFLIYGAFFLIFYQADVWQVSWRDPVALNADGYVPLFAFYRGWPAVGFAVLLTSWDWRFAPVLLLHIAFFYKEIARQAYDFAFFLYWLIKGRVFVAVRRGLASGYRFLSGLVGKNGGK